jgi:hypothetical protein
MARRIRSVGSPRARRRVTIAAIASIAALLVPLGVAGAAGPAACSIKTVSHPNSTATPFDQLYGIDALSGSNIWAVGSRDAAGRPLVLHWNGHKWSIVPSPGKGPTSELNDVTAVGPRNAWAVGYYVPSGGGHIRTLIEHWNGNKWVVVPSPNPIGNGDNFLKGVDAVSGSDIWAVGANGRPGNKTIIEHWNGNKWVTVAGAPLGNGGDLNDVSAISHANVVAVGHSGITGSTQALVERWNGHSWAKETVSGSVTGADLLGVSTPGTNAQWAAGTRTGTASLQTLTVRNTGSGWNVVNSPNVGATKINILNDVSAVSAGNAWAVGERENDSFVRRTLVEHFEGGAWHVVASPNVGSGDNRLFGVTTPSGTNVWAAGTAGHPIGSTGLIEHHVC